MSAIIKLSSKLPGDEEINGLDNNVEHFLNDETPVLCLAWVVTKHITKYIGAGDIPDTEVPTVEVRRIEPIGIPKDVPQSVHDLAAELYEERTGRNPLPLGALIAPAGDVHMIRADDDEDDDADPVVKSEPRLNRGPESIGEIFSFNRPDADTSAEA